MQIAIIGASGYTGVELIRLLYTHPKVTIHTLAAHSSAGQPISAIYPHLAHYKLPAMLSIEDMQWDGIELAFCCLPHATSHEVISKIPNHIKVIDLSADFRFSDIALYEQWYGTHTAKELQKEAVYGLPELYADAVKKARLIACPGCYPTSAILPLFPLLKNTLIHSENIIIDSKSGVSGAGRSAKQAMLFAEIDGGFKAYGIASHRHLPEIAFQLSKSGTKPAIEFTPHLVPMNRGILSTIYVKCAPGKTVNDLRAALEAAYKHAPFVHIVPDGHTPSTREVYGTNHCHIGIAASYNAGGAILTSVIDNLTKGSSGQAVQNMNLMYGWEETLGLEGVAVYP
jgi:N-acetyl-gamma-glutamyl-phosphate reductase